jgi:serine/threonine protein kinase/predicted Zn-dependent protease
MTLAPGTRLGPYEILAPIGAGGMGEVYRACDTRLDRRVAIKVLLPKYAGDPDCLKRFEREAKATAALSHPNILAVHDIGRYEGSPYLVEELLEGESLKIRLGRGAVPLNEAIGIAGQIVSGLEAAHEKGIIHRDLKPANVFVTAAAHAVKILDFGLAKLMEFVPLSEAVTVSDAPSASTETGRVLGTAGYMSPEQVRGLPVDQRSDIFSFGCLLYEMVTAKRAFLGDNVVSTMAAILEKEPSPPREIVRNISPELEWVILKCLQKEPERRFQTAAELRLKLEDGQILAPARLSRVALRDLGFGIRKLKWLGLALLILAAISAALFYYRQTHRPAIPSQKNLVVLPFKALGAGTDQVYCDGMTETVTTKLAGVQALQVLPVSQVLARKAYTPEMARRELGANLVLRATWQRAGQRVRINMNLIDSRSGLALRGESITAPFSDLFGLQDQVVNDAVQMLGVALKEDEASKLSARGTQYPSAYDYYLRGIGYLQDYAKLSNVRSAISVFNQALRQDPKYALALAGLGQAYWREYLLTHQSAGLDEALGACRRSLGVDPSLADGHACLGVVYNETGEYAQAAVELEQAIRLNPHSDDFLRGLASAYQKLGKIDEAERTLKSAIALRPQYWANYSYLGAFYFSRGRYSEAAGMFEQVIKLAPDSFRGYYNLGGIYVAMDRLDEAIPVLERSIRIYPTAAAYSNLGTVYLSRRQFPEAARVLEQAVKLEGRFAFWGNLGEALFFIPGRHGDSVRAFQEAVRLARARLEDSPRDSNALSSTAYFEAMAGTREAAQRSLAMALATGTDEPAHLIRLAKASSQLGDDRRTIALIEKVLAAGGSTSTITDSPHFDALRGRSARLRELLESSQSKIRKGEKQ